MTPQAALIAVGTELLRYGRPDGNGCELSRMLEAEGIATHLRIVAPDDIAPIARAVQWTLGSCSLVVVTGGIGPTLDDLSRDAIASALGVPLVRDADEEARLSAREERRGRTLTSLAARQADLPEGSEPLPNPIGTARGFLFHRADDRIVIALPGVPAEMRRMMREEALPRIAALAARPGWSGVRRDPSLVTRCLKSSGLTEAEVQERLAPLFAPPADAGPAIDLTILSAAGEITFLARGEPDRVAGLMTGARSRLGAHVFTEDPDEHLERVVGRLLDARGRTVAAAESCTGGLLMALVTSVPGASRWFDCGWVTYADASKESLLGVPAEALREQGAVSEPVVLAMARAARRLAGAAYGLSITGIAGPDGGSASKPVGLVWLGLAWDGGERAVRLQLSGDRETIRMIAARAALDLLRRKLLET